MTVQINVFLIAMLPPVALRLIFVLYVYRISSQILLADHKSLSTLSVLCSLSQRIVLKLYLFNEQLNNISLKIKKIKYKKFIRWYESQFYLLLFRFHYIYELLLILVKDRCSQ